MDLLTVGSISQYTRTAALKTQWKLKKQSGDLTGHGKSLRDYVSFTKASDLLPDTEEQDKKLSAIVSKAEAGKKLTEDEWDYLKAKAPELYAKLREIEREAESHEEALRRCKTKDEAMRLHVAKLGEILTAAKNGDSGALFRLSRMTQTMNAFTESDEYRDMPTEAEEAIERESERRAELEAMLEELEEKQAKREPEDAKPDSEEAVPEAADDTGAEADEKGRPAAEETAKRPPRAEHTPDNPPHATDTGPDAHRARERETAAPKASGAISPGRRAYLEQQSGGSRDRPHRRSVVAEA